MSPDDPRHGTEAGCREHYRRSTTPCAPCLEAHRRANIMRRLYPHKVTTLGARRRVQALQAIGYSRDRIAAELGYTSGGALTYIMQADTMLVTTATRIGNVYDRLSMTVPRGAGPSRARTWARRYGYAPPLAWDDIDTDLAPSGIAHTTVTPIRERTWDSPDHRACSRCGIVRETRPERGGDLCVDCRQAVA